jgi:hypothetical protein
MVVFLRRVLKFSKSVLPPAVASPVGRPPVAAAATAGSLRLVEVALEGLLQSDVCCCSCGHTSSAFDPFR